MFEEGNMVGNDTEEDVSPGIFERGKKFDVKLWEVRMVEKGSIIDPKISHTIQHYLATYFDNVLAMSTYQVCQTSCGTGFRILSSSSMSRRTLLLGLLGAHAYINSEKVTPSDGEFACQNTSFHDLDGAKRVFNEFYDSVLITSESEVYEDLLRLPSRLRF